jgi:hypothetical protein
MTTCDKKYLEARCRERGYTLEEVMGCVVSQDGDQWTIDVDHPDYPRVAKPGFVTQQAIDKPGPGSELKALLATVGIHASPTCKCNKMAAQMNEWGEASLDHIEEIVDVMEETAKGRSLPFLRVIGRKLVKMAVRRWQKKANSK